MDRRSRSRAVRGAATLAAALMLLSAAAARADIIPSGMKVISPTFEIENMTAHPELLFVAFPFGACFPTYDEHFELNPHLDRRETNYEVLRPGVRYDVQKFCGAMQIYAMHKASVHTRTKKLTKDLDWYRKKGHLLTLIDELELLKTTQKITFFDKDPRVLRSGVGAPFPLVVPDTSQAKATHDVLRVAKIQKRTLRIVGSRVVIDVGGGKAVVRPYVKSKRPDTHVSQSQADQAGAAPPAPARPRADRPQPADPVAAAGTLTPQSPRRSWGRGWMWAIGALALVSVVITAAPRRRRGRGRSGSRRPQ